MGLAIMTTERFVHKIGLIKLIKLPEYLEHDKQCRCCLNNSVDTAVKVKPNYIIPCCLPCFISRSIENFIRSTIKPKEENYTELRLGKVINVDFIRKEKV